MFRSVSPTRIFSNCCLTIIPLLLALGGCAFDGDISDDNAPDLAGRGCRAKGKRANCPDAGPPPVCGDAVCEATESCSTCAADCGECAPVCGDGSCNGTEDCSSCPGDCGTCAPVCGDGSCNGTETCADCPGDCGACGPVCGDGTCQAGETCSGCPGDCGVCPPACGDGTCNGTETCSSCPGDCGVCPPVCGDGTCNGTETCSSCPGDCGTCAPTCDTATTPPSSGFHNPGKDCLACHDGATAPLWTAAGTLYNAKTTVGGVAPAAVSGATMHLIDATGKDVTIVTSTNGNFYTNAPLVFPLRVKGSKCPDTQEMNGDVNDGEGSCNGCHSSTNRIHLP